MYTKLHICIYVQIFISRISTIEFKEFFWVGVENFPKFQVENCCFIFLLKYIYIWVFNSLLLLNILRLYATNI